MSLAAVLRWRHREPVWCRECALLRMGSAAANSKDRTPSIALAQPYVADAGPTNSRAAVTPVRASGAARLLSPTGRHHGLPRVPPSGHAGPVPISARLWPRDLRSLHLRCRPATNAAARRPQTSGLGSSTLAASYTTTTHNDHRDRDKSCVRHRAHLCDHDQALGSGRESRRALVDSIVAPQQVGRVPLGDAKIRRGRRWRSDCRKRDRGAFACGRIKAICADRAVAGCSRLGGSGSAVSRTLAIASRTAPTELCGGGGC